MDGLHGLLHQLLRVRHLLRRCFRRFLRHRKMNVHGGQGLADFIVQLAADPFAFLLLDGQHAIRQMAEVVLHHPGLVEQHAVMFLALAQGFLGAFAFLNFLLEREVRRGEFVVALGESRIQLRKLVVGLAKPALHRLEWRKYLHEKRLGGAELLWVITTGTLRRGVMDSEQVQKANAFRYRLPPEFICELQKDFLGVQQVVLQPDEISLGKPRERIAAS